MVQHECDHLDGILYPMRMDDLSTFGYSGEKGRGELPLGERMRGKKERRMTYPNSTILRVILELPLWNFTK